MARSLLSALKKFKMEHLFEVRNRIKDAGNTTGFPVAFSESLILFHTLDMNTFRLNGYSVLRVEDLPQYRVFTSARYWQFRAVKQLKLKPIRPVGVSVQSFPELLQSVAKSYPLMAFHIEEKKPDVCYIGPLVAMTKATFTIEDLDANAEWSGPRRMKFCDLTRLDFGSGYENALAATAPARRKRSK